MRLCCWMQCGGPPCFCGARVAACFDHVISNVQQSRVASRLPAPRPCVALQLSFKSPWTGKASRWETGHGRVPDGLQQTPQCPASCMGSGTRNTRRVEGRRSKPAGAVEVCICVCVSIQHFSYLTGPGMGIGQPVLLHKGAGYVIVMIGLTLALRLRVWSAFASFQLLHP